MNYEMNLMQKMFASFGYAVIDANKLKLLLLDLTKESMYNDALKISGMAMIDSIDQIMDHSKEFSPELRTKLEKIYDEVNKNLDDLQIDLLRIKNDFDN